MQQLTSFFILCLSLFQYHGLSAQKQVEQQQLCWIRYQLKLSVNKQWQLRQELEERAYWFPWRQHQALSRTMLERSLGKGWSAAAGLACFVQSLPHHPGIQILDNQFELRPQLEFSQKTELSKKVSLNHRYWIEFRFFELPNKGLNYANSRWRYKLELHYYAMPKLTLKVFDEIFIQVGNNIVYNVFDQNRIGLSLQYMPSEYVGFELGYLNWFQQRSSGHDFYQRHILRFSIYHNIKLISKRDGKH